MSGFRWYRMWRGGKWAQVTGWFFGKRWLKVAADSPVWDENWN